MVGYAIKSHDDYRSIELTIERGSKRIFISLDVTIDHKHFAALFMVILGFVSLCWDNHILLPSCKAFYDLLLHQKSQRCQDHGSDH